jgi:hypothetical protein
MRKRKPDMACPLKLRRAKENVSRGEEGLKIGLNIIDF